MLFSVVNWLMCLDEYLVRSDNKFVVPDFVVADYKSYGPSMMCFEFETYSK